MNPFAFPGRDRNDQMRRRVLWRATQLRDGVVAEYHAAATQAWLADPTYEMPTVDDIQDIVQEEIQILVNALGPLAAMDPDEIFPPQHEDEYSWYNPGCGCPCHEGGHGDDAVTWGSADARWMQPVWWGRHLTSRRESRSCGEPPVRRSWDFWALTGTESPEVLRSSEAACVAKRPVDPPPLSPEA